MVAFAVLCFAWFHFSKKVTDILTLTDTLEAQNAESEKLKTTLERIQTLKSLQTDLRIKVFGNESLVGPSAKSAGHRPVAGYSRALSTDVLAVARKSNVAFASLDPAPSGMTIRFWGRYPDISNFLNAAESRFARLENFVIEKSKNGGVILSITVPTRPS